MTYLLTILGFVILIASGKYLVQASVNLAQYLKISTLVIGVTVVAFGTSAPELLVSVQAAIQGHPEISIGNVVGSNIANIALVLALTALILPVPVNRNSIYTDWPVMMFVTLLFYLFVQDNLLDRWEGILFNIFLIAFVIYSVRTSQKKIKAENGNLVVPSKKVLPSILIILAASVGLIIGADLLVENVSIIAIKLGVSERAIAVTMIAVGTSIPELVTSVMAAIQKEMDISVGNIIGSNIFNILSVLGITAIIKPVVVSEIIVSMDIIWMIIISVLLFLLMIPAKRGLLSRLDGGILLGVYLVYIYLVFV